jgi:hypothetical protein
LQFDYAEEKDNTAEAEKEEESKAKSEYSVFILLLLVTSKHARAMHALCYGIDHIL